MKRKAILLSAFALAIPCSATALEGGFIGLAAAVGTTSAQLGGHYSEAWQLGTGTVIETEFASGDLGISSNGGNFFLGYGWRGRQGFFALEANMAVLSGRDGIETGFSEIELDQNGDVVNVFSESYGLEIEGVSSYGASILMGMEMGHAGDATLFLRAGWQVARYDMRLTGALSGSKRENFEGPRAGLGVVLPITETVGFRMEWSRHFTNTEKLYSNEWEKVELELDRDLFEAGILIRF